MSSSKMWSSFLLHVDLLVGEMLIPVNSDLFVKDDANLQRNKTTLQLLGKLPPEGSTYGSNYARRQRKYIKQRYFRNHHESITTAAHHNLHHRKTCGNIGQGSPLDQNMQIALRFWSGLLD
jgi:hypothetical protein